MNTQKQAKTVHIFRTTWLICLVFVSIGSLMPGSPDPLPIWGSDKLLHLMAYGWLALLQPLFIRDRKLILRLSLCLVVWGVLLEGGQSLIPYRSASFWDFVANTMGVTLGTALGLQLQKSFSCFRDQTKIS